MIVWTLTVNARILREMGVMVGSDQSEATSRYRLLLDLARDVTGRLDLAGVLEQSFLAMRRILDFTGGSIQLVDDEGFISLAATDPPATPEALAMRIPIGQGIGGRIALTGEPRYLPDITADIEVTLDRRKRSTSGGVRSYFGVPLITEGRVIGVLQVDSTVVDAWTEDDRLVLLAFTPIVAAAVQNARLFERELAAVQKLRELDQRHRDFVAVVSHELRTPLTSVLGFADTVINHHAQMSQEEMLDTVARARAAAVRLAVLVDQLLDLSVIQSGKVHLVPETTDIGALLGEVVTVYGDPRRDVYVTVGEEVGTVELDQGRFQQVVGNLLSNALKYSPADLPVEIAVHLDRAELTVAVTDRGRGIPVHEQERIFEQFVQLDSVNIRSVGGFGIGLYIVARVAAALGGRVEVDSDLSRGSTFRLCLPVPS